MQCAGLFAVVNVSVGCEFWGPHVHAICSQNRRQAPESTLRWALAGPSDCCPTESSPDKHLPGARLADKAALRAAPAGSSLGSEPTFFAFSALPFLPVLEEACGAWASLRRPVCSQEGH